MNKHWILLLFPLALVASLNAEPDSAVQEAPSGSQWSVKITPMQSAPSKEQDGKAAKKAVLPVRMDRKVAKNGDQQGEIFFSDGTEKLFYLVGTQILQPYDNSDEVAAFDIPQDDETFDSLRSASFPGTSWISKKHFVGDEKINGQECHKYRRSVETYGLELQAWIRSSDRFPVRIQIGQITYDFSAVESFSGEITLPPRYREAASRLQSEQRALEAMQKHKKP